jgi:hypothetical protein
VSGFEVPVNATGSFVRVELFRDHPSWSEDTYILSLAEVEVFGGRAGAPTITRQPQHGRASVGRSATFFVEANGTPPLNYQWEKDEVAIEGATGASLILDDVDDQDAGEYSVVVTNNIGSVASDFVTLAVTPPNLAVCGVATQSTNFFDSVATLAIDENVNGDVANVTHTTIGDPLPWWEVRLAETALIDAIVLWNRTDGAQARFSDLNLSILDSDRQEVYSQLLFPGGASPTEPMVEISDIGVEGEVVRVEKAVDNNGAGLYVSLAEVEVFGDDVCTPAPPRECPEPGEQGYADTHCELLIVEGPEDERGGDYRVNAQANDESGDTILYTFAATLRERDVTFVLGPQEVDFAYFPLTFGTWDIAVLADDGCPGEAQDATCTRVIEVQGDDCVPGEICNVAPQGVASQSSDFFGPANIANDGNTDGDNTAGEVTHTGLNDSMPTWEVELDQDYPIERITLWNRTDCCGDRLTNFTVKIFTQEHQEEVFSEAFFTDGVNFPDETVGFRLDIQVGGVEGRIVQVQLQNTHPGFNAAQFFLSLAEVQVFAETPILDLGPFIRGDVDGSSSVPGSTADMIYYINWAFLGSGPEPPCKAAADADGDGFVGGSTVDILYLSNFLFLGSNTPPPAPFPGCGTSSTPADRELGGLNPPPCP